MRMILPGIAVALALTGFAHAEDPARFYDQLFASRAKAALATRDKADDAAVAASILEAAETIGEDKAIQLYLAEKAYDVAAPVPEAQATAVAAAKLIGKAEPKRAADSRDRVLRLLKAASIRGTPEQRKKAGQLFIYEAELAGDALAEEDPAEAIALYRQAMTTALAIKDGDARSLRQKIENLADRAGVAQRISQLREKLLADATDKASAAALVELYVIEQNNPAAAANILKLTGDPVLIANVTAAQKPAVDLTEAEALTLGDWYQGLATKASAAAKPLMLRRAATAYERYLALHATQDTARLKATVVLREIERELAGASTASVPTPPKPVPVNPTTPGKTDEPVKAEPAELPYRLKDYAITDDLQITGTKSAYTIESWMRVTVEKHLTITVGPGVEIRGGTIDLVRHGHLRIKGDANKPAVLRDVKIVQHLSASFAAEHVIFEHVSFHKGGGWFAGYSSKWVFANCILHKCAFPQLTNVDYGFQFRNCSFTFMNFPEAEAPYRNEWRTLDSCNFIGCAVPPSIGFCAVKSNFYACTFPAGAKWKEASGLTCEPYLFKTKGPPPQVVWGSEANAAKVTVTPPAKAYDVFKFPVKPGIAELREKAVADILFE